MKIDPTIQIIETEEPVPCGIDAAAPTCEASPLPTLVFEGTPIVPVAVEGVQITQFPGTGSPVSQEAGIMVGSVLLALLILGMAIYLKRPHA
jgi:hypothetical protein